MPLALAIAGGLLAYSIGAAVRRHASRLGLIDVPNARSAHDTPTPRGGGIGIVFGTVGGSLLLPTLGVPVPAGMLFALVVGGLLVAAVSFLDDVGGVRASIRLFVHLGLGAAVVLLVGPIAMVDLGPLGPAPLKWTAVPLTVLWIAGIINAYNFMDGIDGLAAGQSLATAGAWVVVGLGVGRGDIAALALLIAGTSAGFLLHNWTPARLFMGDVGSAFLGYALGLLVVIGAQDDPGLATAGVVFLWPFVFDTALTLARRAIRMENIFAAHRSHFYQRLLATGCSQHGVLALYLGLAVTSAAAGSAVALDLPGSSMALALLLPAMVATVWILVQWREARSIHP